MDNNSISALFNRFAGNEIQVSVTKRTKVIDGDTYVMTGIAPAKDDPTLKKIEKVAKDNGLSLRVLFPNSAATMDYRTDRVNVYVSQAPDGKYRVGRFSIG